MNEDMVITGTEVRNTGIRLPRLVFGTGILGNLFHAHPEELKRRIMEQWFLEWPRPVCIDTAGKYGAGLALEVLGRQLVELGITPDDVVISNKLAWRRIPLKGPEPTFEPGAWFGLEHDAIQDISYEGMYRCWEEGKQLLGSFPQQMVSVHDPDEYLAAAVSPADRLQRLRDIDGAYEALEELRSRGLAAAVGVGAKDWCSIRELTETRDLDWAMSATSLTIMSHPPELVRFMESMARRGISVINSAVFHSGFLLGGDYFDYRRVDPSRPADRERMEWRRKFLEHCRDYAVDPATACIAFALSAPGVVSVALSTSHPERVREHVAAVSTEVPSDFWQGMKRDGLIRDDYAYVA